MSGNLLICGFLLGIVIYLYRDRIRWDPYLFIVAAASVLCAYRYTSFGDFLALPGLAYVTVFLGICSPPKLPMLKGADYSYGIFLYGYPIQQALYAMGPLGQTWFLNGFTGLRSLGGLCGLLLAFRREAGAPAQVGRHRC